MTTSQYYTYVLMGFFIMIGGLFGLLVIGMLLQALLAILSEAGNVYSYVRGEFKCKTCKKRVPPKDPLGKGWSANMPEKELIWECPQCQAKKKAQKKEQLND